MAFSKIARLHFLAITSRTQWSESSSPLELYVRYGDHPNDKTTNQQTFQISTTNRAQGMAIATTINLPSDVCYIETLVLKIKGDDWWLPKTLAFYAEDEKGYVYPIVEFLNWPDCDGVKYKATAWSTDPSEGLSEIQIFPLVLEG